MRDLSELEVLIVDCQTTGASPKFGSVLEIGWCVVSSESLRDHQSHWVRLPDGERVSSQVRRLTGYEDSHAASALSPRDAWDSLRASMRHCESMPAAIHFARFEVAFLRDWAARFEPGGALPLDATCVHAIACRLYPDLPRRTLRALAGYLGHGLHLSRRSHGHVEATAFVWRKLAAELAARGITRWDALQEWLASPAPTSGRSGKRKFPLPSTTYRSLPDEPGVYRLVRSNGDVLYVGKATSLKKRVASHFTARSKREHSLEMLTQVSDVQVALTASALEAALLERQTIQSLRPPYNVQLMSFDQPAWFSNDAFDHATPAPDEVHRIGPLPSVWSLTPLGALIELRAGAVSRRTHARALGVADRWAPSEEVFAAGYSDFCQRHSAAWARLEDDHRRSALAVARKILLEGPLEKAEEDELAEEAPGPVEWDPERVSRHMDRAVAQAYQLYRRARWLRLLHDSTVAYREPQSDRRRMLSIRDGELVVAIDAPADVVLPSASIGRTNCNELAFDRSKYDRLRILTTELKRVRRDHGEVTVWIGRSRPLQQPILDGILRLV